MAQVADWWKEDVITIEFTAGDDGFEAEAVDVDDGEVFNLELCFEQMYELFPVTRQALRIAVTLSSQLLTPLEREGWTEVIRDYSDWDEVYVGWSQLPTSLDVDVARFLELWAMDRALIQVQVRVIQ